MGGGLTAIAIVTLVFIELALFGGDRLQIALFIAGVELIALGLLIAGSAWFRSALTRSSYLAAPALLLLLVMLWGYLQALALPWPEAMRTWPAQSWAYTPGRLPISIDTYRTITEVVKLGGIASLALIGAAIGKDDDRAHLTWNTIGVLGGIYVAFALIAYAHPIEGVGRVDGRLSATLGGPNPAATVLSIFVVMSWTALLRAAASLTHQDFSGQRLGVLLWNAAPWVLLLVLSFGALSLTGSRGGAGACFVGLLASTIVMTWGEMRNRRALGVIAISSLVVLACFTVLVMSSGSLAVRLSMVDDALANRREIISVYLAELAHTPWTGMGLGTFHRFNQLLIGPGHNEVLWNLGALHNVFLQWIFEAGFLGAAAMFSAVGILFVLTLGGLRRRRFGRTWIAGSTAISTVVLSHGLIDFGLQVPAIAALWALVLGVGVSVSRPSSSSRD